MRLILAALALLIGVVPAVIAWGADTSIAITGRAVPLSSRDPALVRVGALRWTNSWVLESRDPRFGGLSGLVAPGGGRLLAVSDTGPVVEIDTTGRRPVARMIATVRAPYGVGPIKASRDAESMTPDPATGMVWIGFEGRNTIGRFDPGFGATRIGAAPPAMAGWPQNGGPETLVRLADGRMIVIAETAAAGDGARQALLFAGDPTTVPPPAVTRFAYRPPDGYDPSDGARLPDGRVLVLNRRLSVPDGFSAILTVIDPAAIRPGATITGTPIATLAPPLTVDNMEGAAIERVGGRTILWLVSDDNFLPFQRTLLMRFALP